VESAGRIVPGSSRLIFSNSLTVIGNPEGEFLMDDPPDLCESGFSHLSIGDPDSVPAGEYTKLWLQAVRCGSGGSAWLAVQGRLAPAPDVRAALAQVEGSIDAVGVVYRTDILASGGRVKALYHIPVAEGPRIVYLAALCEGKGRDTAELAESFLDYFSSGSARNIIEKYGFVGSGEQPGDRK